MYENKSVRINFQLPNSLIEELNRYASNVGQPKSKLITEWIEEFEIDRLPSPEIIKQQNSFNFNIDNNSSSYLDLLCKKFNLSKSEILRIIIKNGLEKDLLRKVLYDLDKYKLNGLFQYYVDTINHKFKLQGTILAIVKNKNAYARTFSYKYKWDVSAIFKITRAPAENIAIAIDPKNNNYVANSILYKSPQLSHNFHDFSRPIMSERVSNFAASIVGIKSGMSFPLIYRGWVIGIIFVMRNLKSDFGDVIDDIVQFTNLVSTNIVETCILLENS